MIRKIIFLAPVVSLCVMTGLLFASPSAVAQPPAPHWYIYYAYNGNKSTSVTHNGSTSTTNAAWPAWNPMMSQSLPPYTQSANISANGDTAHAETSWK